MQSVDNWYVFKIGIYKTNNRVKLFENFRSGVSSLSSDSDCRSTDKNRTAKLERLVIMLRTAVDKLKEENKNLSLERVVTNTDDKVCLLLLIPFQCIFIFFFLIKLS